MIIVNIFISFPQKYNYILQVNLLIVIFINLFEYLLKCYLIISLLYGPRTVIKNLVSLHGLWDLNH